MKKEHQNLAIVIISLVAFIFLYFNFLLLPLNKQIEQIKKTIAEKSEKLKEAKQLEEQLPKLKQEIQLLQLQITNFEKRLPKQANIPELIKIISKEAQYHNIKIFNLVPKDIDTSAKEFNEVPFSINFIANYHSLAQFLTKIAQGNRIFAIRDLNLNYTPNPAEKENYLSGSCILFSYTLK